MDIENIFYQEIIASLNKTNVEFILVGGLAVGFHGYSRYTGDMDLWLNPEPDNIENLFAALHNLGYSADDLKEISLHREVENPTPIKLWDDSSTFKVDLMTNTFQDEYTWQDCRDQCTIIQIGDTTCPVVHINHLIWMKKNTKRLDDSMRDLVDATELEKILKAKNEE